MSEHFKSLRHLTSHVDEQVRIYSQLQAAISTVGSILDTLPEKKRELEAVEAKIVEAQQQIVERQNAQQVMVEQFRASRQETAALVKIEQQERVTQREAWRLEAMERQKEIQAARQELADIHKQIVTARGEAETLEKELASTVKAVLRR